MSLSKKDIFERMLAGEPIPMDVPDNTVVGGVPAKVIKSI